MYKPLINITYLLHGSPICVKSFPHGFCNFNSRKAQIKFSLTH